MTHIQKDHPVQGALVIGFGVVLTLFPLINAITTLTDEGGRLVGALLMGPFVVAGLFTLLAGVNKLISRKVVTLRNDEVECDEVSLRGRTHWKEAIKRYAGVTKELLTSERPSKTRFQVVLEHPDPRRNIVLFRSGSWQMLDPNWIHFARILNLPAIEKTPHGIFRHSPREFDHSRIWRRQTRDLNWIEPENLSLGPKAKIEKEGSGYRVSCSHTWEIAVSLLATSALAFLTFAFYLGSGGNRILTVGAFGLLTVLSALRTIRRYLSTEVLFVSSSGVELRLQLPWQTQLKIQFPGELVTGVQVKRSRLSPWLPPFVMVLAHQERLEFATSLPQKDKDALSAFIITVLCSEDPPQQNQVQATRR